MLNSFSTAVVKFCVLTGSPGDDRHSVAIKDMLDVRYPRVERSECVVRLEPIQTTTKAVYQYLTTEEELARYPSHTTRYVDVLTVDSRTQFSTSEDFLSVFWAVPERVR